MKWTKLTLQSEPAQVFKLFENKPYSFFLDTALGEGWSFLGAFPYKIAHSLEDIENELNHCRDVAKIIPSSLKTLPFIGGAAGFMSYEASRLWEPRLQPAKSEPFHIPDILFGFYDTFLAFNHQTKRFFLICLELTSQSVKIFNEFKEIIDESESFAQSRINPEICMPQRNAVERRICSSQNYEDLPQMLSNFSFEEYDSLIQKAKKYIQEGEIYQVNLSQCFKIKLDKPAYAVYQILRKLNPAPFCAYFNFGEGQILSSSPERFLSVCKNNIIHTEPIKGTIQRGKTSEEDETLKQLLLESEKNKAELMMIVDLERNDLGKICHFGSVQVPILCELRSFSTVHHLVAIIQGKLKTQHFPTIMRSTFPGGSITGAPKLRAMQIIDELEPHNRGIYTGSIGYIDYRRQIDLNIAIRTIIHQKGHFYVPLGGGITWDSNSREEYEETLHKGHALISALSYGQRAI